MELKSIEIPSNQDMRFRGRVHLKDHFEVPSFAS